MSEETLNTDKSEELKVEKPEDTIAQEDTGASAEQTPEKTIEPPSIGIDETGQYFVVRVHISHGEIFIRGWLRKAEDVVMGMAARMREEARKKELVKPVAKGFGRFKLFKG